MASVARGCNMRDEFNIVDESNKLVASLNYNEKEDKWTVILKTGHRLAEYGEVILF